MIAKRNAQKQISVRARPNGPSSTIVTVPYSFCKILNIKKGDIMLAKIMGNKLVYTKLVVNTV